MTPRRTKLGEGETNESPRHLGGETAPFALLECFTPNPRNPRKSERDLETLGASLVRDGQHHAVVAVSLELWLERYPKDAKLPGFDIEAHFVTLMGSGRLEAARLQGVKGLRYELRDDLMNHPMPLVAAAMENIAREQLTCMDEARMCKEVETELLAQAPAGEGSKVTADRIAEVFSKSRHWVNQRLGLMRLVPEVQAMIDRGGDGPSLRLAREASALPPEEQLPFVLAHLDPAEGDTAVSPDNSAESGSTPGESDTAVSVPRPRAAVSEKAVLKFMTRYQQAGDARTFGALMAKAYDPGDFLDLVAGGAESLGDDEFHVLVEHLQRLRQDKPQQRT